MYKIKIYCNNVDGNHYWEDGVGEYETYDKALIACYRNALQEAKSLMEDADRDRWFEVEETFEIAEAYMNEELKDVTFFETATVYYDHAPQDRENDCDIQIVTGYKIVQIKDTTLINEIDKYNKILKEEHGEDITVEIKSHTDDDGNECYYYTSVRKGFSDDFKTVEEAYNDACIYLKTVGIY